MVWFDLTIGKFETKYKMLKEEVSTESMPYCDSQSNILIRVNETEQIKTKINDWTIKKTSLQFKKQRDGLNPQEEEELKKADTLATAYSDVMALKPYFVNEATGEIHLKALRKLGDEALEKSKRTRVISDGEYRVCELKEKEKFLSEQRGAMLCPELYKMLKELGEDKAVKFTMNFGYGNNEERVYAFPSEFPDALVITKVGNGRTKFRDALEKEIEELKEYTKLKEMLKAISLQESQKNKNKIASLDD